MTDAKLIDARLLEDYALHQSGEAFAELVRRHADWIHSAAVRIVRDPHLAEDVTQAVFLLLSQRAEQLRHKASINGWLFNATRYSAAHAIRSRARREKYEREAAAMTPTQTSEENLWADLAPDIEKLVAALRPNDRNALLLRFYQQKTMAEVGAALGVSEDAAGKRVAAALDRLRQRIGPSGAALSAALLSSNITHPCPPAIIAACAKIIATVPAASTAGIVHGVLKMMLVTKIKIAAIAAITVGACVAAGVGVVVIARTPADVQSPSASVTAPSQTAASGSPPQQVELAARDQLAAANPATAAINHTAPALDPALENTRRLQCAYNMRTISLEMIIYAQAHGGRFPPDLGTLGGLILSPAIFLCPDSGKQVPQNWSVLSRQQKGQWINANSSYTLLTPNISLQELQNASSVVALFEASADHGVGSNLAFADGHVEFQNTSTAAASIQATKTALEAMPH